jgi:hypothetical protein
MMLERYAKLIQWANENHPKSHIYESLSPNQLTSKRWLINELVKIKQIYGPWSLPDNKWDDKGNSIEIVGSWYGFPLIDMLSSKIPIRNIDCWDIDFEARMIAKQYIEIFKPKKTQVYDQDYFHHERDGSRAHLLINTSSEHMTDSFWMMDEMFGIPREHLGDRKQFYVKNPLIVIQSNNMRDIPEHVNCVDSADELVELHKIKRVAYKGEQNMIEWDGFELRENGYKRFMVIGRL